MLGKWWWFISSEVKFTVLWQVSWFMNQEAWNQSLHKVWETATNTQWRCGRMSKITANLLNTAVFGHMELYNRSNVAPTESHKMSEHNIFFHSSTNKSANLPKRQAIAGQHAVKLLFVLNDAHNPINNPTVQIVDPRKQNTLLAGNYKTDRRTISHHEWHTILAI